MALATVDEIDELLPQTQCGECGYNGCRPYAEAICNANAPLNLCPPGGVTVLRQLGARMQVDVKQYEDDLIARGKPITIAKIIEADCIGCTKCIQACPVDAIIGSGKVMHTVLTDECTGCGLCVAPCPVDCIVMLPIDQYQFDRMRARNRMHARLQRIKQPKNKAAATQAKAKMDAEKAEKKAYIAAALLRKQTPKS